MLTHSERARLDPILERPFVAAETADRNGSHCDEAEGKESDAPHSKSKQAQDRAAMAAAVAGCIGGGKGPTEARPQEN